MIRPIFISTSVFVLATSALADTMNVGPGQSIQDAIVGASDGDEIVVAPGTYNEALDFMGKAITVRSSDGAETTIVDASGHDHAAVKFNSYETLDSVFDGFTVTGGAGVQIGANRHGGGVYIRYANPRVSNCIITGNTAAAGGGIAASNVSFGVISNCTITGNTATAGGNYGGGGLYVEAGGPTVVNCSFSANSATGAAKGGGMTVFLGSPSLTNCSFYGNQARHGAGIMNDKGSPTLTNCTFSANVAVSTGGAMRSIYDSAHPVVTNSIFWGNSAGTSGDEILDQAGAATTVDYTTVAGGWSGAGSNNASSDPMFADAATGDLRLDPVSPCVDAGSNAVVQVETDLDGNDRIFDGGVVDLGAYENQGGGGGQPCLGDVDESGDVGFDDLVTLLSTWGSCPGCAADLDLDDDVDFSDLVLMLERWGLCP